jgi:undecaprenol kinase
MKMGNEWSRLLKSFRYAGEGIIHVWIHEKNMRIHVWMAFLILLLSLWARIPIKEILFLLLMFGMIWSLEMVNTAIEKTLNLVTGDYHPLIKIAKDAAAGAVLICSCFSVLVGVILLYEPLSHRVKALSAWVDTIHISLLETTLLISMNMIFMLIAHWLHKVWQFALWLPIVASFLSFMLFLFTDLTSLKMLSLFVPIVLIIFLCRGVYFVSGLLQMLIALNMALFVHLVIT